MFFCDDESKILIRADSFFLAHGVSQIPDQVINLLFFYDKNQLIFTGLTKATTKWCVAVDLETKDVYSSQHPTGKRENGAPEERCDGVVAGYSDNIV